MKKASCQYLLFGLQILFFTVFPLGYSFAQGKDLIIDAIVKEATENSQSELLAHQLLDGIGPRLVGTPQMENANKWVADKYKGWGISSRNEKWGEWPGWERGITHIDMISPWVRSLEGTQLAWSPSTDGKTITGDVVIIPDLPDYDAYEKWLPSVKGKFVLISANQPSGRPNYNWEEFSTPESLEKMKAARIQLYTSWNNRLQRGGLRNPVTLQQALKRAGAVGVIACSWTGGFGTSMIMDGSAKGIPSINLSIEDYGLLFRLSESGKSARISVRADSKERGTVPVFNTIAEIKGTTKADEYVMLSAHLDSWDGGTGATDNGTGTILMMETMRILKKIYPNPKRTILVGHWGSEEQGLNGSRAFVEDHPEITRNIQAAFNQDNGTGRVIGLSGEGFKYSADYLTRWLSKVPENIRNQIALTLPGNPASQGGSDHASFQAVGVPTFFLNALEWNYFNYTWHTNRDTYDKIVFDDLRSNAILTAILVYMACEDPEKASREKAYPDQYNPRTGKPSDWPQVIRANRNGSTLEY